MIKLIRTRHEFISEVAKFQKSDIGLVATMGNLHDGHLTLLSKCIEENNLSIVTIFVNPKQFGPNEDFDKYPRTLEADVDKITNSFENDNIIIFAPNSTSEIYPKGFDTKISVGNITKILCGANRPGHFDGVTTVVYQLFKLSNAKNAYFGQKDYQQVKVIEAMKNDLQLDIDIKMLPISRDIDQLARSSRNQYLSNDDRKIALTLTNTISNLAQLFKTNSWVESQININEIIEVSLKDSKWDYLEILDADNLYDVSPTTTKIIILGAYKVNSTRLIDNRIVEIKYA